MIGVRFPALEPHDGFALESNFDFATLYYMRVVCVCVCVSPGYCGSVAFASVVSANDLTVQ